MFIKYYKKNPTPLQLDCFEVFIFYFSASTKVTSIISSMLASYDREYKNGMSAQISHTFEKEKKDEKDDFSIEIIAKFLKR